jgi:pyruvate formate lyase activating enzyme
VSRALIFDVKKYAVHDGPGIRTTVFFKGCPLRCAWCHNPEGQEAAAEVMVKAARCLPGCRACVKACLPGAITRTRDRLGVDRRKCDGCGACADACPSRAIELAGRRTESADLVTTIFEDAIFHESSGGGVTFSGGEPLMQPDALEEVLAECRRREARTAIDTCGCVPPAVLKRFLGKADLFLYDFKVMDEAKHKRYTGVSNRAILDNLRILAENAQKVNIRIPLIAGVNDDDENIGRTAEFLRSLKIITRISLLPYHNLAEDKYRRLDREKAHKTFAAPSSQRLEQIKAKLEGSGFTVAIGD